MDNNIIKIDEENLKNDLKGVIRKTIEETLNTMLDEEAAELCNAERHEQTDERRNYRSGHYHRKLLTSAGVVDLSVPKLRLAPFETAIIERYRRRESSVEESLIEMYLAGVRETLTYLDFPHEHWRSIRTNNILERLNREIRRRTRVVGCLQKHPRLGYENMQACFRITRLAAFSRTGNLP